MDKTTEEMMAGYIARTYHNYVMAGRLDYPSDSTKPMTIQEMLCDLEFLSEKAID